MSNSKTDESDRKPLDPTLELVRRKMIRTLAISIGSMFIGLIAVAAAIVYKVSSQNEPRPVASQAAVPADAPIEARAALPAGFAVQHVALAGSRILFYGQAPDGSMQAFVFDTAIGRFTAHVTVGR